MIFPCIFEYTFMNPWLEFRKKKSCKLQSLELKYSEIATQIWKYSFLFDASKKRKRLFFLICVAFIKYINFTKTFYSTKERFQPNCRRTESLIPNPLHFTNFQGHELNDLDVGQPQPPTAASAVASASKIRVEKAIGNATWLQVSDLQPNTLFSVRLMALNAVGTSQSTPKLRSQYIYIKTASSYLLSFGTLDSFLAGLDRNRVYDARLIN